jgi:hypothetical protein
MENDASMKYLRFLALFKAAESETKCQTGELGAKMDGLFYPRVDSPSRASTPPPRSSTIDARFFMGDSL